MGATGRPRRTTNGRPGRRLLLAGLALVLLVMRVPVGAKAARLKIAATIFPLYDIVRHVAGPLADVVLILAPGSSPHTFDPRPAAVRSLSGAAVVFVIGHGLDDWAARLASGAGVPSLVRVDQGIALRRGEEGVDPHYWLAAANAKVIAATVATELERLAPDRREAIRRSLAAYHERLDAADAEVRRLLGGLSSRRIATVHDAFGYFAAAYSLEVIATFEPYPGLEPSPRFVVEFQHKIGASGIRTVFTEPQLSVEALRPIARDLGATLGVLDPLGGLPGRGSYVDLLLFDARAVVAATRGVR